MTADSLKLSIKHLIGYVGTLTCSSKSMVWYPLLQDIQGDDWTIKQIESLITFFITSLITMYTLCLELSFVNN